MCLAGTQILLTVSLTPAELPQADVVLGSKDSTRLRMSYHPAKPVSQDFPTPPEPMELDNEDSITSLLQGDPFAMERLQRAADELMRESGLIEIVERVMTPPPLPQPGASQMEILPVEIGEAASDGSGVDERSVLRSVVVVPIRKKMDTPIRKNKKKKWRKNRKCRDISSTCVSSFARS